MAIVTYSAFHARHVRGTDVKKGQTLYAIEKKGWFFVWSYSRLDMAEFMDAKLAGPQMDDPGDCQANWRRRLDKLHPTDTKPPGV